jgi:hypothetical protein
MAMPGIALMMGMKPTIRLRRKGKVLSIYMITLTLKRTLENF